MLNEAKNTGDALASASRFLIQKAGLTKRSIKFAACSRLMPPLNKSIAQKPAKSEAGARKMSISPEG
jgi:hypothetical protein